VADEKKCYRDWFRKRKKNSIFVLENFSWGQENYRVKGMI
jgi:hypothetical protein